MHSFPSPASAVVIGAGGGIGAALARALAAMPAFETVVALSRRTDPLLDLTDEVSIAAAAHRLRRQKPPIRLIIDATGFLHGKGFTPEKSMRQLNARHFAHAFAVNATGPALLIKNMLPLLPRDGKAVFATLSARVGSIADNRLGGWWSYRASKAALNQIVRTAAIEWARTHPDAVCLALHPGTVDTGLSHPFWKSGLTVRPPDEAAADLLQVIDRLDSHASGGFYDYRGDALPW